NKVDTKTNQVPLQLGLNKINLADINVDYRDDKSKMHAKIGLKEFETIIQKIDLATNSYNIGDINLDGLDLDYNQKTNSIHPTNSTENNAVQAPLQLGLNKINLTKIKVDYKDENSKTFAKVNLNNVKSKINKLDLKNSIYDIDHIILKGSNITANLHLASTSQTSKSSTESSTPINLSLNKLILDDTKIVYNNTAIASTKQGMDYNHLNFSKLNLDLENLKMFNGAIAGSVKKGEIKEVRGLNILRLNTDFLYGEKQTYLKKLHLQTPKTLLRDEIFLTYNSINQLTSNPGNVSVNAKIRNSKIGFSDILNLVPTLKNTIPFDKYPNAILNINTQVRGKVNDLTVNNLALSGLDDLSIIASGRIVNVMNP
ncbi:MAG: translocation/assembly module TamB, partial [Algoriella sp.]